MDKSFLGLGVMFNGIDNGLTKVAKSVADQLGKTTTSIEDTEEAANGKKGTGKGGIFSGIQEGFKQLSLGHIMGQLGDIRDQLSGRGAGLNDTAVQLDMLRAKMTAAFDPKQATQFTNKVMGLIPAFGLTGDQAETIAQSFTNAGGSVAKLQQTLPMVGTLVGKLGMDAEKVAGMFGTAMGALNMGAEQAKRMTKEVFRLQKQYQLTDLMTPLPEIIENVYKNSVRFGKINSQQSAKSVIEIMKMAAAFQKVGHSQQNAIQMATGWNDKMADIREAMMDIQAGLEPASDSFIQLQEAMAAGGLDPSKVMNMIMGGAGIGDVMKELQGEMAGLSEQGQLQMMQRLKRVFGPEIASMVGPLAESMNAVDAAAQEQDKSLGTASSEFAKLEGALGGTIGFQEKLTKAAKEYNDIIVTLANKNNYIDVLTKQREGWNMLTDAMKDSTSMLARFQTLAQGLENFGLGFLFPSLTTASPLIEIFQRLLGPVVSLLGIFTIFKGPLAFLGKGFMKLGKNMSFFSRFGFLAGRSVSVLAKVFTRFLGPIGLAITAFEILYHTVEPFRELVDGIVVGLSEVGGAIMDLFSGNISWEQFTTKMGDLMDRGIQFIQDRWQAWATWFIMLPVKLLKAWGSAAIWIGKKMTELPSFIVNNWKRIFVSFMLGVPGLILTAFDVLTGGRLFKRIEEGFSALMTKLSDLWQTVKSWLPQPLQEAWNTAIDFMSSSLSSLGSLFSGAASSMATGMKGMLGGIFDMLPAYIQDFLQGKGPIGSLMNGGRSLINKVAGFFGDDKEVAPQVLSGGQMANVQPSSTSATPTAEAAVAMATMAQPEAPSQSPMSGRDLKPTKVPKVKDENTQALLQMVADMKDTLAKLLTELIDKPTNVVLQGDARKMLSVVNRQGASDAGAMGLASSVGR